MATITGVAGTSITATTTVSDDGQPIDETESAATAQSIENDLATIKSGTFTSSATATWSGIVTMTDRLIFPPAAAGLSDAAHTINVTAGTWYLHNAPAAQRLITVSSTVGPPALGERIRVIAPSLGNGVS